MLKADELLIVCGKEVCVLFPPSLLRRLLSEGKQKRATGSGNFVVIEQSFDIAKLQAGPGQLIPADLGRRPSQRSGDDVSAPALSLPDRAQLRGQPAAPYSRAPW